MIDKNNESLSTLVEYLNTYRKYVWTVLAIALYAALADLAMERAENTRIAILENDGALQDRINIAEIKSVAKKSDEMIKMKVTLSTTG